jgi:hypothetical protein
MWSSCAVKNTTSLAAVSSVVSTLYGTLRLRTAGK